MAEEKQYTIPLRRYFLSTPRYRRSGKAVKAIKKFIARHMKTDFSKVKIDTYSNMQLLTRGRKNPPGKVKVIARKDENLIKVELADISKSIKFKKINQEKLHKKEEKKPTPSKPEVPSTKPTAPTETKPTDIKPKKEKTDKEKQEEKEKEQSVAQAAQEAAQQTAKQQKHTQIKQAPKVQRKALKK
jgi:large subunit ribosomal protein L31e